MDLTDEQRKLHEKILAESRAQIEDLDRLIEEELNKVKGRIDELQNAKRHLVSSTTRLVYALGFKTILRINRWARQPLDS